MWKELLRSIEVSNVDIRRERNQTPVHCPFHLPYRNWMFLTLLQCRWAFSLLCLLLHRPKCPNSSKSLRGQCCQLTICWRRMFIWWVIQHMIQHVLICSRRWMVQSLLYVMCVGKHVFHSTPFSKSCVHLYIPQGHCLPWRIWQPRCQT